MVPKRVGLIPLTLHEGAPVCRIVPISMGPGEAVLLCAEVRKGWGEAEQRMAKRNNAHVFL